MAVVTCGLVLFDLDGTLIDTIRDLSTAVDHALGLRGLPGHTLDEYRGMVGHGVRDLVYRALPEKLRGDEAYLDACLADFKAYYTDHIDVYTRPYAGMPELLADLQAAGVKLAVASNKFQSGTEHLVHEFFPGIRFCTILGNREGYPLKPSPEIVDETLRVSGVPRERAVLVGDSLTDMQTASNGGIRAIAVSWGFCPRENLVGGGSLSPFADRASIADSVAELRRLLLH